MNPYSNLPDEAFWRSGVAERNPFEYDALWTPRFAIEPRHKIATAGSCFAQHIGRALSNAGYGWMNYEPAPPAASKELQAKYNYGVFSFRTGNIYTTAALLQWLEWALNERQLSTECWESEGRYFDPFRPAIEPNGFASPEEVAESRQVTLAAIRRAIEKSSVFVFTLGLTEGWVNTDTEEIYAMCPGTVAGDFDASKHKFKNFGFMANLASLTKAIRLARSVNPRLRFLLTVSPVPLTATASDRHVLVATSYSKSVLRAVAGALCDRFKFVDYFPSYEIITSPLSRGVFFESNMRSVTSRGVATVMDHFFRGVGATGGATEADRVALQLNDDLKVADESATIEPEIEEAKCEDVLLQAFARDA